MPRVPPGDETDIYYIIIAGLPWQCSWQKLKDFARNQQPDGSFIEIDHALVYADSTDGWVRVRGKKSFRKALAHLDGGVLDHRCLVADGRNETEITTLRDAVLPWSSSLPRRHRNDSSSSIDSFPTLILGYHQHQASTSGSTYSGSEGLYSQHQPISPISPTIPSTSYYQQPLSAFHSSNPAYPPVDYFPQSAPTRMILAGDMAPTTQVYVTPIPQPLVYTYMTPIPYVERPPSPPSSVISVVKTEARKIIITQVPHSASRSDLEALLLKYIAKAMSRSSQSKPSDELEDLDIARHFDQKPRGHAFAILGSHQIAKSVVKSLDGLRFQGRILQARLAKEGVESSKRESPAAESYLMSPPAEEKNSQEYFAKSLSSAHHGKGKENANPTEYLQPQITAETMQSSEIKSRRSSDEEQDGKKLRTKSSDPAKTRRGSTTSPLVVNGSFRESSSGRDGKSKKYH